MYSYTRLADVHCQTKQQRHQRYIFVRRSEANVSTFITIVLEQE
jgi:hypothetical protein